MSPIAITPETRVADLLEAYPALEDVLVEQAACFKALKNPILRRTVARVATLEKAAQMGGLPVRSLVAVLRQAAGQSPEVPAEPAAEAPPPETPPPAWFAEDRVRQVLNADGLLAAGEMPLARIKQALRAAAPGDLVCLVSSFRPAPLLDALAQARHPTWVRQMEAGCFHIYIARE
ncbi:MAG: DUF1858 domain-containing protein [Candidatus Methylomirabilales bacterium]